MSTILKALRRLEEDKRAQARRSLEDSVVEPAVVRRRVLGLGAGVGLAVGGALLGMAVVWIVFGTGGDSPAPSTEVAAVATAPPPKASSPPPRRSLVQPAPPPLVALEPRSGSVDEVRPPEPPAAPPQLSQPSQSPPRTAAFAPPPRSAVPADPVPMPAVSAPAAGIRSETSTAGERPLQESGPDALETEPQSIRTPDPHVAPAGVADYEPLPSLSITQTVWHPDRSRRIAVIELAGRPPQRLAEGDVIAGFTIAKIGLTSVELTRDGVTLERRVGSR